MTIRPHTERRPLALAAAGAACISSSAVLVQLADVGAATTAFFRCLLALPALGVFAVFEQRRYGRRSSSQRFKAAAAGIAFAVDLVLWNHAIVDVGAGVATVLGNLQVIFVAVAAWVMYHERPSARFLAALPVVAVGVVLVAGIVGGSSYGRHPVAGILFGVGTSVAYAVFLLALRRLSSGAPHVAGPLVDATAGAAISALAIGLVVGSLQFTPPWPALGWLLVLATVSQTLGWLLITSSLPRLPAAVSSLMLLLQPAAAVLLAAVVLSQHPTSWQLIGAALVCAGVVLAAWRSAAPAGELIIEPPGEQTAAA
ncbi:MAG: DMT family transporter [Acidimicrobiales bacterium]